MRHDRDMLDIMIDCLFDCVAEAEIRWVTADGVE